MTKNKSQKKFNDQIKKSAGRLNILICILFGSWDLIFWCF